MTISLNGDILVLLLVVVIGWMLVDMYNGVIKNTMPVIYLNPHSARDSAIIATLFTCIFLVGIIVFQTVQANINFDLNPIIPDQVEPSTVTTKPFPPYQGPIVS
jgi:hypothetical protein